LRFSHLRFTNAFLLAAVLVLTLSGVYGLFWSLAGWVYDLHRYAAWALVAAIPWKLAISARSLRRGLRPDVDRGLVVGVSLLLAAATLAVLALGFLWKWRLGPAEYPLRQTAISWHWMLALGLLVPFAVHVWRRWPRPKPVDFASRRAFLRLAGLTAAGLLAWRLSDAMGAEREQAPRRSSGSRLDGVFTGNAYPVTHNVAADEVDLSAWRLAVGGQVARPMVFSLEDLLAMESEARTVTLDCTLGWYTVQEWRGVPLAVLLELAGAPAEPLLVRLESVTGYGKLLPWAEARDVLLATHIGGEPLSHLHGAPLRAVVPTRRGWYWVKWLEKIEIIA
jgi:hypothetical protein